MPLIEFSLLIDWQFQGVVRLEATYHIDKFAVHNALNVCFVVIDLLVLQRIPEFDARALHEFVCFQIQYLWPYNVWMQTHAVVYLSDQISIVFGQYGINVRSLFLCLGRTGCRYVEASVSSTGPALSSRSGGYRQRSGDETH